MNDSQYTDPYGSRDRSFFSKIKRINFRPYLTGMLPLFLLAHFGHHGIGAMMNPLQPMIRNDLKLDYTQIGLMRGAFMLTGGLSQLPAGIIADKLGVRIMVLLGVTGVAIAGFFLGFTDSFTWLVVFMVISAILGAGYHPASAAAISSSVKEEYRGRTLGIHLIGGTSAFWIFPLIATPIADRWGWQTPYLYISIPIAIAGIILYFLIGKQAKVDARRREESAVEELPEKVTSINWSAIISFLVISVFTGTVVQSAMGYLSLYAVDELGVSEANAGFMMSITPAIGLVAAPLGGYLADRFGSMRMIFVVAYLSIPLVFFMGRAPNVPALITLMIIMGLIMNTRMPTSESYLTSNVPANKRATIMGIYYFSGTGIGAPLSPVVGKLIDAIGFARTFTYASITTAAITVICSLFLWRGRRNRNHPEITG
ncbi:MAG: MFS transporter [Dehalococcoidales bacterium]|nr:MAG: MFS transporter [Dehalococcoidales bacterium]